MNHIFFHHWQDAADNLRSFMAMAPLITDSRALYDAFVRALQDFAAVNGLACYMREGNSPYQLQCGNLAAAPPQVDDNVEVVLAMRHTRRIIDVAQYNKTLPGEYALPMLVRGQVNGFVLIGAKSQGVNFRPEELVLLAETVHEVGLDLESLRVVALERMNAELASEQTKLSLEIAELRLAVGGASR